MVMERFPPFNPQAEFVVTVNGETITYPANTESTVTPGTETELATWFPPSGFENRWRADRRADPDMEIDQFLGQFHGLKTKTDELVTPGEKEVLDTLSKSPNDTTEQEAEAMEAVYGRACEMTTERAVDGLDKTIGSIGDDLVDGLHQYETGANGDFSGIVDRIDDDNFGTVDDMTVYYGKGGSYDNGDKTIPFYYELAAVPTAIREKDDGRLISHILGVNQSILYDTPTISLNNELSEGYYDITSAFRSMGHNYTIVSNIYCPNVSWQDRGKQGFDLEPFKQVISEVVGKAIRKIKRDIRPRLNDLRDGPELDFSEELYYLHESA